MFLASNLTSAFGAAVIRPSTTCTHAASHPATNRNAGIIIIQPTHTVNAANVTGSATQKLSGMTNNAELGIPLHSMHVANAPQSSLQLAIMLHAFGSREGSQL
jgi:hypothetical protein